MAGIHKCAQMVSQMNTNENRVIHKCSANHLAVPQLFQKQFPRQNGNIIYLPGILIISNEN